MGENVEAIFVGAVCLFVGVGTVLTIARASRRNAAKMEAWLRELTPSQILAEAAVAAGGDGAELRARTVEKGAHKVWLHCTVESTAGRWTATAQVAHRTSPPGGSYRDGPAEVREEAPIRFGDDGEGISTIGQPDEAAGRRTGALAIPRPEGGTWLQLLTLPAVAEDSELVVRATVTELEGASGATFRAFIGVSER